jgi:hypothetical protein
MFKTNQPKGGNGTYTTVMIVIVVLLLGGFALAKLSTGSVKVATPAMTEFAKCLTEKGAVMYGAEWCGHCKSQKLAFGSAVSEISYVECTVPGNPSAQAEECRAAKVDSYPTWVFADGSRQSGAMPMGELAERTGCALPATEE